MKLVQYIGQDLRVSGNQVIIAWMLAEGVIPLITGSTEAQIAENLHAEYIQFPDERHQAMNRLFYGDSNAITSLQYQYFID